MPVWPATVMVETPSLDVATRSTLPVCGALSVSDVGDRAADQADRGRGVQRRAILVFVDAMFVICSTMENDDICCIDSLVSIGLDRVLVLQLGDEQLQEAVLVQRGLGVGGVVEPDWGAGRGRLGASSSGW